MKKNAFLSAQNIVKKLIENNENFNISESIVQRFLNKKGFSWKVTIIRIKNEVV